VSAGLHASWGPVAVLRAAAALSLLVRAVHLWVVPEHLVEWWGYGAFFLVLAVAQGLYALVLLRRPSRPLLLLGVGGNLAVTILWLVTRPRGYRFGTARRGDRGGRGAGSHLHSCGGRDRGWARDVIMRGLPTEGRIQIVVVLVASSLLFWHLLHLLAGSPSH
jgi:hypothetical protein